MEENETVTSPAIYAVSLATAQTDIKSYKTLMSQKFTGTPVNAFTIRHEDFLEAIGYTTDQIALLPRAPYSHARMYMAYNSVTGYKMYITPVTGADLSKNPPLPGTDTILSGEFKGLPSDPLSTGQYVFDLVAPCPSSCDTTSPLYNPK